MNELTVKLKPLVKGALTFIPGMARLLPEGGGATSSASYCYGVWLKHLAMLWGSGMRTIPRTLAELGPGCSLGTGLAAMLSGVDHYRALDVVRHSCVVANLEVLDDLVALFEKRAPRPSDGWPNFDRHLDEDLFPHRILTDELLRKSLAPDRIARIRRALTEPENSSANLSIRYIVPWDDEKAIERDSIDLIVSHAVLGEVDDLAHTYQALTAWLKPGGYMSHHIGLGFAGINGKWNGYWACPEPLWKIIRGRRPFMVNRQPSSTHVGLLQKQDLKILCRLEDIKPPGLGVDRSQLRGLWKHLSERDLLCASLFVQVQKKPFSVRSPARVGGTRNFVPGDGDSAESVRLLNCPARVAARPGSAARRRYSTPASCRARRPIDRTSSRGTRPASRGNSPDRW